MCDLLFSGALSSKISRMHRAFWSERIGSSSFAESNDAISSIAGGLALAHKEYLRQLGQGQGACSSGSSSSSSSSSSNLSAVVLFIVQVMK